MSTDRLPALEKCLCGASVGRWPWSDYWRCDNGHTTYRGREATEGYWFVKEDPGKSYHQKDIEEAGGAYGVFNRMTNEPFYSHLADEYAWPLSYEDAMRICRQLNNDGVIL